VNFCSHLKKYRPIIPIVGRLGTFIDVKKTDSVLFNAHKYLKDKIISSLEEGRG